MSYHTSAGWMDNCCFCGMQYSLIHGHDCYGWREYREQQKKITPETVRRIVREELQRAKGEV